MGALLLAVLLDPLTGLYGVVGLLLYKGYLHSSCLQRIWNRLCCLKEVEARLPSSTVPGEEGGAGGPDRQGPNATGWLASVRGFARSYWGTNTAVTSGRGAAHLEEERELS